MFCISLALNGCQCSLPLVYILFTRTFFGYGTIAVCSLFLYSDLHVQVMQVFHISEDIKFMTLRR